MTTVFTKQGKRIEIIFQSELCDPINLGEYVRAYCHIHGSDHQRSLSIHKASGWGHCFACEAVVLVAEWNPVVAERLLRAHAPGGLSSLPYVPASSLHESFRLQQVARPRQQVLFHPPPAPPRWQREELEVLHSVARQMRVALAHSKRARAYLRERGIPLDMALATGVGYMAPALLEGLATTRQRELLSRWVERLVFPLTSLAGKGYIGRSLWQWKVGMDENAHKMLLDQPRRPRRWIKTNPAGWFGPNLDQLAGCLILVEGAFDRLTLLSAGFGMAQVIALVGTSVQVDWFPHRVQAVILALDADEAGQQAAHKLAERLEQTDISVRVFPSRPDRWGKDWNERWRKMGARSIWPLYAAYAYLSPTA